MNVTVLNFPQSFHHGIVSQSCMFGYNENKELILVYHETILLLIDPSSVSELLNSYIYIYLSSWLFSHLLLIYSLEPNKRGALITFKKLCSPPSLLAIPPPLIDFPVFNSSTAFVARKILVIALMFVSTRWHYDYLSVQDIPL